MANSRKTKRWRRLDNAAKIFPPTSSGRDPRVFRLSCELYEDVDPEILQLALDRTLPKFPVYRSVIKRGLFWYYLEESELPAIVCEEEDVPCAPQYSGNSRKLLFTVMYYKKRLSIEVYHVLSDGAGGIQFLRTLILNYLQIKYGLPEEELRLDYDAAHSERELDSFERYYSNTGMPRPSKRPKASQLRGEKLPKGQFAIIEGLLSVSELRPVVKEAGATITEFLTAVLTIAIAEGVDYRQRKKPVTICVPINLRQYFPSMSARNFFNVINVECSIDEGLELDRILGQVRQSFASELAKDRVKERMNGLAALEHNPLMKVVPLAAKDPIMGAFHRAADRKVTAGLSNIGRIMLPPAAAEHIRLIDAFNSTRKLQVLVVSYEDNLVVNFTSIYENTDVQRRFFRYLTRLGLGCEISTNLPGDAPVIIEENETTEPETLPEGEEDSDEV